MRSVLGLQKEERRRTHRRSRAQGGSCARPSSQRKKSQRLGQKAQARHLRPAFTPSRLMPACAGRPQMQRTAWTKC